MKNDSALTNTQKTCHYLNEKLLSGPAVFGAMASAMSSQFLERASDREKGTLGFSQRFGTKYAQGAAKSTAEWLAGMINNEDPRRKPPAGLISTSNRGNFFGRFGLALVRPFWTFDDAGQKRPAWSRIAGAFASGYIGMAWTPDRQNTNWRALRRTASGFGGYMGNSVFDEFQGDIVGLFSRMFGRTEAGK